MNSTRTVFVGAAAARGMALLAVLVALTLLLLLALPFAVSMSRGADVAERAIEARRAELLSASARDLMLAEAAFGHPTYDPTTDCDDRSEFPAGVPATFPALRDDGRVRFGGEVEDLQRRIALDSITPLILSNLIGTTARLQKEFGSEDDTLLLDNAANLPDTGLVWVDHEVVHYGQKQGNTLQQLQRGMFADQGFLLPKDHVVAETAPVFDWRCVLAVAWPFTGRSGGTRLERLPYSAPSELAEIERAGQGGFTALELDQFEAALGAPADVASAPVWGRPERVFYDVQPPNRTLVVKSALHLGAGSTVRLRNLKTGAFEYGLVMSTHTPQGDQALLLPSTFMLDLLYPVTQAFPGVDTVVEPLVPAPVNVNTADARVLTALMTGCRRGMDVRVHDASGERRVAPAQPFAAGEAKAIVDDIVALRQEAPFLGWQEFAQRVFEPRLKDAGQEQKLRLLYLYRLLLTGRDSVVESGTAPITFRSGPLVAYRAAAAVQRSVVAPAIAARHERSGVAVALPGLLLQAPWRTQEEDEEAFRLDQRAPYYITGPINLGTAGSGDAGNDPVSRYLAHVVAMAFPDAGLGESRYPTRDAATAWVGPGPASIAPGRWANGNERRGHEAFATSVDPRGRDLAREGTFMIKNTGPRDASPAPPAPRTHELTFPFTTADARGGAGRYGISAWFVPNALQQAPLIDYGMGDPDRNRMVLLVRDGKLVFEVIDEAGLDPDPSQSPAGVERTTNRWELPLADLALPPRTPVHVALSAFAGRPSDLSVAVDGVHRGKLRFRTTLTAAIAPYDPQRSPPGAPGQSGDPRQILINVEETEGFPPQGVLRIGTELFEYVGIDGNAFVCAFRDSNGGRAARQAAFEHSPRIPYGRDGRPTVTIDKVNPQNTAIVYPEHAVGSEVELYGYSVEPSWDRPMFPGSTQFEAAIGGFAVARGWIPNGRPIVLQVPPLPPITIGTGLDATWTGDLELADPVPTGSTPPRPAQQSIADAFTPGGGYALLVQNGFNFQPNIVGTVGSAVLVGGVECIRYQSRQGTKLMGVQRAARLPGDDSQIPPQWYDGTAHQFVCDWNLADPNSRVTFDDDPKWILNVVPISLSLQSTRVLPDPANTGTTEWVQLYPRGGDAADTEWVRYDAIADGRMLVRANRAAWNKLRFALTNQVATNTMPLGPLGPTGGQAPTATAPWGTISPTAGYIGYIPRLESDFPQIHAAREALQFRGDPFTDTSSHPQNGSVVLPCHRLDLRWGNFSALTGRPGRNDRVALIAAGTSSSSGTTRPPVEWQTVNWQCRQYTGDVTNQQGQQRQTELLGQDPFQLVAFQGPTTMAMVGRARNSGVVDTRTVDRIVKFPSGELPAASVEAVGCGGAASGGGGQDGFVDEIDVVDQIAHDFVVDEEFGAQGNEFVVASGWQAADGLVFGGVDASVETPEGGGLVQIDDEIIAYTQRVLGTFTIAKNGRGLLNSKPMAHDRGARVHFLTHRPAAILTGAVSGRADVLPVNALGALPPSFGTLLLARSEMLHYCWVRRNGNAAVLEMPRSFPPAEDGDSTGARGLFRGRYGTAPVSAGASEPVIAMPFRYWDRYVPRNDDPEQSYFQFTSREAPVYFRTLSWEEEVQDGTVDVCCLLRADERAAWSDEPGKTPWLRRFVRAAVEAQPAVLDLQATQLEVRFCTEYRTGCLDLVTFTAHAWKTAPRVRHVDLEYEGEGRILFERVTAR